MNINDQVCSLECIKQGDNVHEFPGPVKIILVDPPLDQYNRRRSGAAFIAVASMMIGATTTIMLLFVLGFALPLYTNFHIILCTVGLQFCMPLAILMMHSVFGASAPLKKTQRRKNHILLQIIGLACSVVGAVLSIVLGEKSVIDPPAPFSSLHFISGCVALGLAVLAFLMGPFALCIKCFATIHRLFGILAFVTSSVCFIFGIIKPTMQIWLYIIGYMAPTSLIVFFTTFYTLSVIVTPLVHLFSKGNK